MKYAKWNELSQSTPLDADDAFNRLAKESFGCVKLSIHVSFE